MENFSDLEAILEKQGGDAHVFVFVEGAKEQAPI